MTRQLALPVTLRDGNTLDSFLPDASPEAHAAVVRLIGGTEPLLWLWGPPVSGRSHLLEAAAEAVVRGGGEVAYLALGAPGLPGPAILEGVADRADLVCLDDIDAVAGDRYWEEALFHLFNALRARGGRLVASARGPVATVPFGLPDLASRLALCLAVRHPALTDADRLAILAFRAGRRGLELPPETGRYLLARSDRGLDELVALLDRLDAAALVHQRRLTVPFVRQVLGPSGQAGAAS